MKKIFISLTVILAAQFTKAQQDYCNFDGIKFIGFAQATGQLDTNATNTFTNAINSSAKCGKYIRDTATFDNIVLLPYSMLSDVTPYASAGATSKFQIKIYSSAPVGTKLQLQLGTRTTTVYPAGVHSIYEATTTVQHAWEMLSYNYLMSPPGSTVAPTNIDKILFLYHPNSHSKDTIYFDELTGPSLIMTGVAEHESQSSFKLFQNKPNPAKDYTTINLQLNTSGNVSIKLYDILGKQVSTLADQQMAPGLHSVQVETANIPDGIYFYVVKKDGITETRKMIIAK